MTLKCDESIKTWTSPVVNLKQNIHRKRVQVFCLNSIKKDLKNNDVLLHVDFRESYKNANQDEIQSAYFGQSPFFIFTACAYTCTNGEIRIIPITLTTESNEHSRVTALSCIHKIISHLEGKVETFTKLYIWSYWCASQLLLLLLLFIYLKLT